VNEKVKKITPKKTVEKYSLKERLFCNLFVSKEFYGNGVQSYIKAYDVDLEKKNGYNWAKQQACDKLKNPRILKLINQLLDDAGLNSSYVDKQLLFLITQNSDMRAKMSAIQEFNKLNQRLTDKREKKDNQSRIDDFLTIMQGTVKRRG